MIAVDTFELAGVGTGDTNLETGSNVSMASIGDPARACLQGVPLDLNARPRPARRLPSADPPPSFSVPRERALSWEGVRFSPAYEEHLLYLSGDRARRPGSTRPPVEPVSPLVQPGRFLCWFPGTSMSSFP
jgi:hypothetical protein